MYRRSPASANHAMHMLTALAAAAMAAGDAGDLAIDCCAQLAILTGLPTLRLITDVYDTATLLRGRPAPAEPIDYLSWVETRIMELEDDDAAQAPV